MPDQSLPASPGPETRPPGEPPLLPITRSVLLVEDDADLADSISEGLTLLGYRIDTAGNLHQARGLLDTADFDVVLCDYHLPDGRGLDLREELAARKTESAYILISGSDELGLNVRAIREGALDYVRKPFRLDQLQGIIEQGLERLSRERSQRLDLTQEVLTGAIRALVAAVDAKDPYTAEHSQRVQALAGCLGGAMNLSRHQQNLLEFAALVHDVGKIGVPDAVLCKVEPLTGAEWDLLRLHPVRGAEIIGQVPQLGDVALIVRHHHERYEGGGYPDNLAGEQIPEFARFIAVVDSFEAMTSDRAYRPAFTPAQARDRIAAEMRRQFDPYAAEVFLGMAASNLV